MSELPLLHMATTTADPCKDFDAWRQGEGQALAIYVEYLRRGEDPATE